MRCMTLFNAAVVSLAAIGASWAQSAPASAADAASAPAAATAFALPASQILTRISGSPGV